MDNQDFLSFVFFKYYLEIEWFKKGKTFRNGDNIEKNKFVCEAIYYLLIHKFSKMY